MTRGGRIKTLDSRPDFERERASMGMVLGVGFGAGGLLGLCTLLLPVPAETDVAALVAIGLLGVLVGSVCLEFGDRLPLWAYRLIIVTGFVAITLSIVANGSPAANNELFYLYGVGFVFYYFSWAEASGYALFSLALYLWAENRISDGQPEPTSLVIFAGCLVLFGTLLRFVSTNSRWLVDELERQATTDELTGLLNRRGLQRLSDGEMTRALRTGRPFSLLIGDLDHFKEVNDKLGHMGGDMALERVASGLSAERRAMDSVARIGGEEFAVLMPETDKENAVIAAERFRQSISSTFRGRPVELTLSIGVATYPQDGESWEQLLDAADTALYAAKDGGRDQVVAFGEDSRVPPFST